MLSDNTSCQSKKLQSEFNEEVVWMLAKIVTALPEYAKSILLEDVSKIVNIQRAIYDSSHTNIINKEAIEQ